MRQYRLTNGVCCRFRSPGYQILDCCHQLLICAGKEETMQTKQKTIVILLQYPPKCVVRG